MVVLSERSEPKDLSQMSNKPHIAPKLFSFTHFSKNTSANPLDSHTFKTKDLKPFRFTHFQKKVGWIPRFPPDAHLQSPVYPESGRVTNHKSLRLTPSDATLTSERAAKSFSCNTYKKHTGGEGGWARTTSHGPDVATHGSKGVNHEFPISSLDFGPGASGGPYFPEGPSPKARE
jgi:hypothetical protein